MNNRHYFSLITSREVYEQPPLLQLVNYFLHFIHLFDTGKQQIDVGCVFIKLANLELG